MPNQSPEAPAKPNRTTTLLAAAIFGLFIGGGIMGGAYIIRQPQAPAVDNGKPDSTTQTLQQLAGDAAPLLAQFYQDLAAVVENDSEQRIASVEIFRSTQRAAGSFLQSAGRLEDLAAINDPVSKRLETAIGLDDVPLDGQGEADLRPKLVAALRAIAAELGYIEPKPDAPDAPDEG